MKTVSLDSKGLTLERILQEAADGDVVFLTEGNQTRFALVAVDDGDREVLALRSNPEFMAFLDDCQERARTRPRKSLKDVRAAFDPT
ncbi:MAG: hypothetical protein ABI353_23660 [Isosphaeraceae bacterium]